MQPCSFAVKIRQIKKTNANKHRVEIKNKKFECNAKSKNKSLKKKRNNQ